MNKQFEERFDALNLAMELITAIAPHWRTLAGRNRDLADQLRRAATSAASCLAEGRRRVGKDRQHLFRTAEGSAAEAKIQLQIAVIWGELSEDVAAPAIALADRLVAICYALTRDRSRGGGERATQG